MNAVINSFTHWIMSDSSATDWIQVAISAVGIFFVIQNLREQRRINAEQLKLVQIESNRAAREVKPEITLTSIEDGEKLRNHKMHTYPDVFYSFELVSKKNDAHGVCFEYFKVGALGFSDNFKPGYLINEMIEGVPEKLRIVADTGILQVDFRIHFKDADGREYYEDYNIYLDKITRIKAKDFTPYPGKNIVSPPQNSILTMVPISEVWAGATQNRVAVPWTS